MCKFIFGLIIGIAIVMFLMSTLYVFWFKKLCVSEDETPFETISKNDEQEDDIKVFNTVKDFMRFVNNYDGELIIRNNNIFDTNNNKIAKFKKEEIK